MDVESFRKWSQLPSGCYRYGEPGHFRRQNCPKFVDIRTLTVEELQEILEDKLATLDTVPHMDDPRTPAMSVPVPPCLCAGSYAGFSRNRRVNRTPSSLAVINSLFSLYIM